MGLVTGEERSFDGVSGSVGLARSFVCERAECDPQSNEVLKLVVSELATNAILHARSPFTVRVGRNDRVVTVAICDDSPVMPLKKSYGPRAVTGRGLGIVDKLVQRWGATPNESGKCVWFEMQRHAGATS